nr:helix-turn-helix domain-containing protein [Desulfitobacterium dichloroeliminans]
MSSLDHRLPEAVTLQRFLEEQKLEPLRKDALFQEELLALPLQTLSFGDPKGTSIDRTLRLPLVGKHLNLECEGKLLRFRLRDDQGKGQAYLNQLDLKNRADATQGSFMCPLPMDWEDFCAQVTDWVEREKGRILGACEDFTRHLTEQITRGYGLSILTELKKYLGRDVFLLDKHFKVLAWEGGEHLPFNPIAFVTPKLSSFKTMDLMPETPLSLGKWNDAQYKDVPLSWYPLAGQQGVLGYIGLGIDHEELNPVGRLFLYKTAVLLYFELAKAQSVEDTERQHYRDFLFDLLYNNFDSLEVVQSRGKLWGMDLTKPHMVIVGEIPGYDPDSADRVAFQERLDTVAMILRNQPRTIFLERNDQIVLLYPLEGMIPLRQWEATAKRLLSPLLKLPGGLNEERAMMFGVGTLYESARYIHRSFQEAKSALELGQLFNLQERVILFQELGVMRLLLKLEQQELEDFRNEVLGPLLKFDQQNNLHLEETLLAYLASDGDLNLAGDRLYLHPNTLRYRLKKVAEVLDRDLGSLENRMNLFIALKIGRLKSLWQE